MDICSLIKKDVRYEEGLKACMNCGVCTAICPAAEVYDYDPRVITGYVENGDNEQLTELLKSDDIWYCGQCMSCKARCPRGNCPGLLISVLRKISQELGFFTESEKGRQQYAINKVIGGNLMKYGYCIHPDSILPDLHLEQGPVWKWVFDNKEAVYKHLGANLDSKGPGVLRKIDDETMKEFKAIFDETGATEFMSKIENYSKEKALEMGFGLDNGFEEYFNEVYHNVSKNHFGPN